MEQFLSFIVVIALLMVTMFVLNSPTLFLVSFFGGVTYLILRGRKQGWVWPRRP
jgi:hypothetical protein